MNILIAPDSFKGGLSASDFCRIAEKAIKDTMPDARVWMYPLADGGEGTVDALVLNTQGTIKYTDVTGPIGGPVRAKYGILGDGHTAVIEMASASGLPLVPEDQRDPMYTTTYGTGELVKEVLDRGCDTIIMGIGGSATNDGGAGMMQALGFALVSEDGSAISYGAEGLIDLARIDTGGRDRRLSETTFLVACDVDNSLYGPRGASYVYGPQKGATPEQLPLLDKATKNFDRIIQRDLGKQVADVKGAGAAGGLGAGLIAFLDAVLSPGFEIIRDRIDIERVFKENVIDLVITGEGKMDDQTVNGKLPVGIAKLAKKYGVPVIAVVGTIGPGAEKVYQYGIDCILSTMDGTGDLHYAIQNGERLLYETIASVMRLNRIFA